MSNWREGFARLARREPISGFDPPDRLSAFNTSPFYSAEWKRWTVVLLNGNPATNAKRACVEYCVSERWILFCRLDRQGKVIKWADTVPVFKLSGHVEVLPSDSWALERAT